MNFSKKEVIPMQKIHPGAFLAETNRIHVRVLEKRAGVYLAFSKCQGQGLPVLLAAPHFMGSHTRLVGWRLHLRPERVVYDVYSHSKSRFELRLGMRHAS